MASDNRRNLLRILRENPDLAERYNRIKKVSGQVRTSEYHITNECNIRCRDCWFFLYDFHNRTRDVSSLKYLKSFIDKEVERGITTALLIGGEPTLFPRRIEAFVERMPYVSISSNGLRPLPRAGFENVMVALSVFGDDVIDDSLRAFRPNGKPFTGLLDKVLKNYRDDDRAGFVYAITETSADRIEPTARKIHDNGIRLTFNYYTSYSSDNPHRQEAQQRLLDEALRVKELYPYTVASHPYYIRALISGKTEWGTFGYHSCPSISTDFEGHLERKKNGHPTLPLFNSYAADAATLNFCCTSGHCNGCRDSQAVISWLLVNVRRFISSEEMFDTWLGIAENHWGSIKWFDTALENAMK